MVGADVARITEDIVVRQLAAYDRHDVDTFVACFSEDVTIVTEGSDAILQGRESMRERYTTMFRKFPQNKCTLLSRVVIGRHAIDEELIEGRDGPAFRTAVVYTVEDGLINHVRFLSLQTAE